jgi:hypothetical protein
LRLLQNEISFNARLLHVVISACVKGAQWEVALCIQWEMPQLRLLQNESSFNAGINVCVKRAQGRSL